MGRPKWEWGGAKPSLILFFQHFSTYIFFNLIKFSVNFYIKAPTNNLNYTKIYLKLIFRNLSPY